YRLLADAWLAMMVGQYTRAGQVFEEVVAMEAALRDADDLMHDAAMLGAWLAREQGKHDEARARLEDAIARLRQRPPGLRLVQHLSSLGVLLDDAGRNEEALPVHREALALAKALGSRYHQVDTTLNLVFCLGDLGRHEEAVAAARAVLDLGDYDNVSVLRLNMAYSLRQLGRVEEALEQYDALGATKDMPHVRLIALARAASCLGELGRPEEARLRIDEALEALEGVEYELAIAALACAVLGYGDRRQLESLAAATAGFDHAALPRYLVTEVAEAARAGGDAAAVA